MLRKTGGEQGLGQDHGPISVTPVSECQRSSPEPSRIKVTQMAERQSQEHALWMLKKKAVNKDWDKIMSVPYWAVPSGSGHPLHTKETFSRDSLDLLQDGSMVQLLAQPGQPMLSCVLSAWHRIATGSVNFTIISRRSLPVFNPAWRARMHQCVLAYGKHYCHGRAACSLSMTRDVCPQSEGFRHGCRQRSCGCSRTTQQMCCAEGSLTS